MLVASWRCVGYALAVLVMCWLAVGYVLVLCRFGVGYVFANDGCVLVRCW